MPFGSLIQEIYKFILPKQKGHGHRDKSSLVYESAHISVHFDFDISSGQSSHFVNSKKNSQTSAGWTI